MTASTSSLESGRANSERRACESSFWCSGTRDMGFYSPVLQDLQDYAHDCELLLKGVRALLQDYRLRARKRNVTFALDFSEVHSFLEPERDAPLRRFGGDTPDEALAAQHFVQDYLVFRMPADTVLLDAHQKELQGWVDHHLTTTTNQILSLAAQAQA